MVMKIKKDNALAKLIAAAPPKALSELIMNLAAGSPEIRRECFDYLKENTAVSKMLKSQSEGEAILAISELRYLAESLEAMHDDWQTRNARNIYRQIGEHDKYLELRLRRMEVGADYYDLATFYWETGEKEKSIQIAQRP